MGNSAAIERFNESVCQTESSERFYLIDGSSPPPTVAWWTLESQKGTVAFRTYRLRLDSSENVEKFSEDVTMLKIVRQVDNKIALRKKRDPRDRHTYVLTLKERNGWKFEVFEMGGSAAARAASRTYDSVMGPATELKIHTAALYGFEEEKVRKREQEAREREQEARDREARAQAARARAAREQAAREQAAREQAAKERAERKREAKARAEAEALAAKQKAAMERYAKEKALRAKENAKRAQFWVERRNSAAVPPTPSSNAQGYHPKFGYPFRNLVDNTFANGTMVRLPNIGMSLWVDIWIAIYYPDDCAVKNCYTPRGGFAGSVIDEPLVIIAQTKIPWVNLTLQFACVEFVEYGGDYIGFSLLPVNKTVQISTDLNGLYQSFDAIPSGKTPGKTYSWKWGSPFYVTNYANAHNAEGDIDGGKYVDRGSYGVPYPYIMARKESEVVLNLMDSVPERNEGEKFLHKRKT